ncbi:hypothetical protein NDU88_000637 [Pleurodeles waltl]|uniref:Uncharacterized protein n=1 Tax=Pleurodeles waltl TaxID=8319 RepID=A0AAV7VY39_PLEWA|nr:hypothetical protein NDU88_000637 [Pleurodeles waltl]
MSGEGKYENLVPLVSYCDGSLRSDPHSPRTCADTATSTPEVTREGGTLIGSLPPPRDLTVVKRRLPPFSGEGAGSRSWSKSEFSTGKERTAQEDADTEDEETSLRRSPVVKTADPGKPVKEPPCFRRSVATPGTGVRDEEKEREAKKGGEVGKETGTTPGALTVGW